MKIFGHDFQNLGDTDLQDLITLERERVIYADHWIDGLDDFRHVRIRFQDEEVAEYARSMRALDLFLGNGARWARDVEGIPQDIATRADTYQLHTKDGRTFGPPWHCPAAFMGDHLEELTCTNARSEVLDEQGTAAFLSTIRRAVDALTPAIRCFTSRETGLTPWPISREDDIRDLLYAMLRASISDIKREEPVPSRVGTSKVADLHSGLAKTLIEIKWIGRKGQWRRILDQIHVDIQTYGRHPNAEHLIFVVVDAVRDVPDPYFVERELSGNQVIDGRILHVLLYVREP
jgi:REase_DpnII-MboI